MKKLLILLTFLVLTTFVKGQDIAPADTAFHALPTYSFKYYTADSSVWIYKGVKYKTTKLASYRTVQQKIDSLYALGYTNAQIDSLLLGKQDTLYLSGLTSNVQNQLNAKPDSADSYKYWTIGIPQRIVKYGRLYNWYAATDVRNIAPVGFHVPSNSEWQTLANYLGLDSWDEDNQWWTNGGGQLKESGLIHWNTPNEGADNLSGFTAVGSGVRYEVGFGDINEQTSWWSSDNIEIPNGIRLEKSNKYIFITGQYFYIGRPIRFIADSGTPTTATGNDGKVYPCVTIGGQTWTAVNSMETKYRNGDWVHGFDGGVYTPISNSTWAGLTSEAMCAYNNDISNVFEQGLSRNLNSKDTLIISSKNGIVTSISGDSLKIEGDSVYIKGLINLTPYELVANKQNNLTTSSTKYPTVDAVNAGLGAKQDSLSVCKIVLTNNITTYSLPFTLKSKSLIFVNGSILNDNLYSGIGTSNITLYIDPKQYDYLKILN
jgi:uncharacterized protein (TIGR02145 family)